MSKATLVLISPLHELLPLDKGEVITFLEWLRPCSTNNSVSRNRAKLWKAGGSCRESKTVIMRGQLLYIKLILVYLEHKLYAPSPAKVALLRAELSSPQPLCAVLCKA